MVFICLKICSKSVSQIWYIHPVIVVGALITHKMFDTGTKHQQQTSSWKSMWVNKFNLQSLCQPNKMYHRYSWYTKNTWYFLYLFLWSVICRNQIEKTLYPHLWVCEQFCCKILVQNGDYSLFQAKWSSSSAQTLNISSWLTPKNVMEEIFSYLLKTWSCMGLCKLRFAI